MSHKHIPCPRDPLLAQLWLLKGTIPLEEFTKEFNSWGVGVGVWSFAERHPRSKFPEKRKPRTRWEARGELRYKVDYGWKRWKTVVLRVEGCREVRRRVASPPVWTRRLSYYTIQRYLLGRGGGLTKWNRHLIRRKIIWLRNHHPSRTRMLWTPTAY
jgi:hypothetical protein